jgi:hypothetical protein
VCLWRLLRHPSHPSATTKDSLFLNINYLLTTDLGKPFCDALSALLLQAEERKVQSDSTSSEEAQPQARAGLHAPSPTPAHLGSWGFQKVLPEDFVVDPGIGVQAGKGTDFHNLASKIAVENGVLERG